MFVTVEGLAFFIVNICLLIGKLVKSSSLTADVRAKLLYEEVIGIGLRAVLEDIVQTILTNL